MLGALSIPPRLVLRALDDDHSIARDLNALVESVKVLPRTEDELSSNIALLRTDIQTLNLLLAPLIASLLQAMLKKLPGI